MIKRKGIKRPMKNKKIQKKHILNKIMKMMNEAWGKEYKSLYDNLIHNKQRDQKTALFRFK